MSKLIYRIIDEDDTAYDDRRVIIAFFTEEAEANRILGELEKYNRKIVKLRELKSVVFNRYLKLSQEYPEPAPIMPSKAKGKKTGPILALRDDAVTSTEYEDFNRQIKAIDEANREANRLHNLAMAEWNILYSDYNRIKEESIRSYFTERELQLLDYSGCRPEYYNLSVEPCLIDSFEVPTIDIDLGPLEDF